MNSLNCQLQEKLLFLILKDPDGYEICFVRDKGYRLLSQIHSEGNQVLTKAIAKDKSAEWFAKKG